MQIPPVVLRTVVKERERQETTAAPIARCLDRFREMQAERSIPSKKCLRFGRR
jgi:hypothetical protein